MSPERAPNDDILGWSSPYESFSERSEDWIDEALETMRGGLVRHQARRFATPTVVEPASSRVLGDDERAVREELGDR